MATSSGSSRRLSADSFKEFQSPLILDMPCTLAWSEDLLGNKGVRTYRIDAIASDVVRRTFECSHLRQPSSPCWR